MQKRMGDLSLLLIGIRSPDYQANLRYAEALTQKLRAQPPTVVSLATYHVRDVRDFFERNKWLYVSEDDLEAIRDRLRSEISKRKNPLYVSLGEDESIDAMRARMSGKSGLDEQVPGRRVHQQGRRIRLDRGAAAGRAVRRERGRGAVQRRQPADRAGPADQLSPRTCAPRWRGRSSTAIASRHAVERDILWVTDHLPGHRRDLDRPLLPPAARHTADRHPGR